MKKENAWDTLIDKQIDKQIAQKKAGQRWLRALKRASDAEKLNMLMPNADKTEEIS